MYYKSIFHYESSNTNPALSNHIVKEKNEIGIAKMDLYL